MLIITLIIIIQIVWEIHFNLNKATQVTSKWHVNEISIVVYQIENGIIEFLFWGQTCMCDWEM